MMDIRQSNVFLRMETTCGSLLYELQEIWDELGEPESGRDDMLMEIEQQCLEIYRRKVDQAYQCRAQLRQAIADAEGELAQIFSALGERPTNIKQPDQKAFNLKEELNMIIPFIEETRKRKSEREKQFVDVLNQICQISNEIHRSPGDYGLKWCVDEKDLSMKRLEELLSELHALQKEKSDRLKQLLDNLNALNGLCSVLGMDFKGKIQDIHPTLDDSQGTQNISDDTILRLSITIQNLRETKIQRLQMLQDLASTMLELWNLMDTPPDEQRMFHNVISMIASSEDEITEPNCLSVDFISHVNAEVLRLERLKSSKMKDLILKKRSELEEICRQTKMGLEGQNLKQFSVEAIHSGAIDPSYLLEQIELQIFDTKEEAFSRKEILERVEKWKAACEEECWLEEYNRDEFRYNGGRGGHLSLKRAEKARVLVSKLPAMVETLTSKTRAWEKERGKEFLYDGVQVLSMLEDYSILRQEKERERQWQRDQKKLQGRLLAEQEALFGSKPSPTKSSKKAPRYSMGGGVAANRRCSLGGTMLQNQNLKAGRTALHSHPINKISHAQQNIILHHRQNGGKRSNATNSYVQKQRRVTNPRDLGLPKSRKPLSPLSSTAQTPIKPKSTPEEQDITTPKGLSASRTPRSTPTKLKSSGERDSGSTQKKVASTPVPVTPSTLSLSTRTATPGTSTPVNKVGQVVVNGGNFEYSFEEIRAGFVCPERRIISALKF